MNTTVNINLANTFFYIDEEAYKKLKNYLKSIKKSFESEEGCEEIMADIEARISELFTEKLKHERQVIGLLEVDEIIVIMGQPEDYVWEGTTDTNSNTSDSNSQNNKKLFRDVDDVYIGGVVAGLGHYVGLEPKWARLIALLLFFLSAGSFLFVYVLLWVLVPEAKTTSEKLSMRGKSINISNIEQKIKEGLDDVTERVKNVDYEKVSGRFQNSFRAFFNAIGSLLLLLVRGVKRIVGVVFMIAGSVALIGLFIGFFSAGTLGFASTHWFEFAEKTQTPFWLISLAGFLCIGIPFFFLFLAGSKILFNKRQLLGSAGKLLLLGIWFVSVLGSILIATQEITQYAFESAMSERTVVDQNTSDTLLIKMVENTVYKNRMFYDSDLNLVEDENGNHLMYLEEIALRIRHASKDDTEIKIEKKASGNSFKNAKSIASKIVYEFETTPREIRFNDYFVTDSKNRFHNQKIKATLYVPSNQLIRFDPSVKKHLNYRIKTDPEMRFSKIYKHTWKLEPNHTLVCVDCESKQLLRIDYEDDKRFKLKIDENGIEFETRD